MLGKEVRLYLGTILVGCARKISVERTAAELETNCQGSGDEMTFKPGKKSTKFSLEGLAKVYDNTEETTNVSVVDLFTAINNDTEVTINYTSETVGEPKYTIVGYLTSVKEDASDTELATYSASGRGNSFTLGVKAA
ncbi:hypothetical protein [Emticicia fontis]